ncbi:hypothetical protein RJ55_07217 [Drechmeria coniospora]|nr:hypothetical protein RJ55_07217 [Drechmeria coniospora]
MPRPRLLPSQRLRAAEACNFCREAKKKCSGTVPCAHCLRRGIGSACTISFEGRAFRSGRQRKANPEPTPTPNPNPMAGSASEPPPVPMPTPASASSPTRAPRSTARSVPTPGPSPSGRTAATTTSTGPGASVAASVGPILSPQTFRSQEARPDPRLMALRPSPRGSVHRQPHRRSDASSMSTNAHSRMLLNLRGERVYIGGAASLSFLQLVRSVVADQIGPSQFSHNAQSETMLEKESALGDGDRNRSSVSASSLVDLDEGSKMDYAQCYRHVTEGFLDVFSPSELEDALVNVREPMSRQRCAALHLAMAIGAQAKSATAARDVGQPCFRQAQAIAFEGMLEDPDIDIVRSFLLMAFYLLGECRRNAAFMYLGIATRAAVALGLHSRDAYAVMHGAEDKLRLRVWISLRIVDMLANAILGRPAATAGLHSDVEGLLEEVAREAQQEDDDAMQRLVASHQIVSIINVIVDSLYERKELSTAMVEQLLNEIELWVTRLPDCLRRAARGADSGSGSGASMLEGALGSIHVSCLYYFAVTLVTRPVLISTLTAPPSHGVGVGATQSHLASACLDAAVFLIQTCVDALHANLLYGNMCIMKALVFAAGLVLGFEIFAKRSIDYDIESAFGGARDVLQFLAGQSPQAGHYHEILTLLANAVAKQRERIASKGRSRYVSKLFTLHDTVPPDGQRLPGSEAGYDGPMAPGDGIEDGDGIGWQAWHRPVATGSGEEDVFLGWDSLDISQWDSFPFVQ